MSHDRKPNLVEKIPQDVPQNVAHYSAMSNTVFPICTVVVAGSVYAQGPSLESADPRGFVKTDMHGLLCVDVGGKVICGRPVERVRR